MTINRSCLLAGHGRSITSESSVMPLFIQQTIERWPAFAKVHVGFSRIKKMLGRIETRTRDRIYSQTKRTVRDISRDDRARIATWSLRTLTDRLKENYSIDAKVCYTGSTLYVLSSKLTDSIIERRLAFNGHLARKGGITCDLMIGRM